ncbi:MAG: Holliday junction resolvase RecU [Bacilli bacterium]
MKYPSYLKKTTEKTTNYSNRGMNLEEDINVTNDYYLQNNIAVIHKKPTPISVHKVHYPNRLDAVITKAYYKTKSTTDYNGVYKGFYIDFEVKETKNKTSFPKRNIQNHQIKHMMKVYDHGGISFIIVQFSLLDEVYLITIDKFITKYNEKSSSISIDYFKKNGYLIDKKYMPRINYLSIVDILIEKD